MESQRYFLRFLKNSYCKENALFLVDVHNILALVFQMHFDQEYNEILIFVINREILLQSDNYYLNLNS